jgi:hypothetical protein
MPKSSEKKPNNRARVKKKAVLFFPRVKDE